MNAPYAGSPIAYDVEIQKNVMVPMRDGVSTRRRHLLSVGERSTR